MVEFGVVVLNYNDFEATLACVRSFEDCVPPPAHLVVVDNKSPNESLAILRRELASRECVEVVDSGRNGGYSFGNNVGIRRLRRKGVDHVMIATSDIEVVSRDIFRLLGDAIGRRTGVAGPQILGPNGFQNPSAATLDIKYILDLIWIRNGMPGLGLRRVAARALRRARAPARQTPVAGTGVRKVYKLHGACLCLTDTYLELVGELDERIFMFGEEDLLAWNCIHGGLEQLLVSDALVRHGVDRSIGMTWGAEAQRFVDRETRKSGRVLKQAIDIGGLVRAWWDG